MNYWAISDKGTVRSSNQDVCRAQLCGESLVAVVCDGMGGVHAGDVASAAATAAFVESMERQLASGTPVENAMSLSLDVANEIVYRMAQREEDYSGMGTTLVSAVITGNTAWFINVGDSRAYIIENGLMRQITKDHSLVQEMIDCGQIDADDIAAYPNKHIITRAVGTDLILAGDIYTNQVAPGSAVLLCSDGLTNALSEEEILTRFCNGGNANEICTTLVEQALTNGASDNVTALVVVI